MSLILSVADMPLLLWVSQPERLETPVALLSAAEFDDVGRWQAQNKWAETVPLVLFGGESMRPLGKPFQTPMSDGMPYLVENAPSVVWDTWSELPHREAFADRLEVFQAFVKAVCRCIAPGPVWVVLADGDEGVCATAVAAARGGAVAIAAGQPTALTARMALDNGVRISVRAKSGDHRRG